MSITIKHGRWVGLMEGTITMNRIQNNRKEVVSLGVCAKIRKDQQGVVV